MELAKCSRGCTRSHYPNEMLEIVAGNKTYKLCPRIRATRSCRLAETVGVACSGGESMSAYRAKITLDIEISASDHECAERMCGLIIDRVKRMAVSKQYCDGHGEAKVTGGTVGMLRSVPVGSK